MAELHAVTGMVLSGVDLLWNRRMETSQGASLPVRLPVEWLTRLDQSLLDHELTALRTYVNRQQPFGTVRRALTEITLGLEFTLRRGGRLRKPTTA